VLTFGAIKSTNSQKRIEFAIEGLVSTAMKTPPDIGVGMLVADMFGVNRTSALQKIGCPTLIIASAKSDELARQQAAANRIPDARFEKVDDAAHAVFIDQPDRFDELVTSFAAKVATTTPHISSCVDRIDAPPFDFAQGKLVRALAFGCESLAFL
jgi:alpha-beta hydrolase superfamily lysophospholipase